jgi:pimeloyl-ACP methyl ester carboxylesterase
VPREMIDTLDTPCVVAHGVTDGIIPLAQAQVLAARLPRAEFYVLR